MINIPRRPSVIFWGLSALVLAAVIMLGLWEIPEGDDQIDPQRRIDEERGFVEVSLGDVDFEIPISYLGRGLWGRNGRMRIVPILTNLDASDVSETAKRTDFDVTVINSVLGTLNLTHVQRYVGDERYVKIFRSFLADPVFDSDLGLTFYEGTGGVYRHSDLYVYERDGKPNLFMNCTKPSLGGKGACITQVVYGKIEVHFGFPVRMKSDWKRVFLNVRKFLQSMVAEEENVIFE